MDIIFMNFINSKTFDPDRLLLNLGDEREVRRNDNYSAL